jgi:hypothetical protein
VTNKFFNLKAFIAVLPKGPAGTTLSSTYEQRRKPAYKNELGNTIGKQKYS